MYQMYKLFADPYEQCGSELVHLLLFHKCLSGAWKCLLLSCVSILWGSPWIYSGPCFNYHFQYKKDFSNCLKLLHFGFYSLCFVFYCIVICTFFFFNV